MKTKTDESKKPTKKRVSRARKTVDVLGDLTLPQLPTAEQLEAMGYTLDEFKRYMDTKRRQLEARSLLEDIEAERSKKNENFIQLRRDHMQDILKLQKVNPVAAQVFIQLCEWMNVDNVIVCSSVALEEAIEKHRTTIWRATEALVKFGFVQKFKIGTATAYAMNSEVVWSTHANKKRFAQFSGRIVVAESEQEAIAEKTRKAKKIKVTKYKAVEVKPSDETTLPLFTNDQMGVPSLSETPCFSDPESEHKKKPPKK